MKKIILMILLPLLSFASIDVKFSQDGLAKDSGEVNVHITNNFDVDIEILKWNTPLEKRLSADIFNVNSKDKTSKYIGRKVKRVRPRQKDYLLLKAGESIERDIVLPKYYKMETKGEYTVEFSGLFKYRLIGEEKTHESKRFKKTLPRITISFTPSQKKNVVQSKQQAQFVGCSDAEKTVLNTAHDNAVLISKESLDVLTTAPAKSEGERYTTWFGSANEARKTGVTANFNKIYDAFENKNVSFNCSECKEEEDYSNIYAYVYPDEPYTIALCGVFWTANTTGSDTQAGTLIHEMSHFTIIAGTEDYVYGQDDAKELAITEPIKATNNADNYEYFAENNPKLEMDVATPTNTILALKSGWNLVGANSSLTLSELKTKIGVDNLLVIQGENKTYQKSYEDEGKHFLNDFIAFEKGKGYWIKVDSDVDIEYNKITYPTQESINLISGWNLINPPTDLSLEAIKRELGTNLESIESKDITFDSFLKFEEPKGYWIKVSNDVTLTFPVTLTENTTPPTKATLTTTPPSTTMSNTQSIEVNGEVGATVLVNGSNVGTIGTDGKLTVNLDTSGEDGTKEFSIVLKDANNNMSEVLVISIEKRTIDDATAIKFLNKTTFGATKESVEELKSKGVEKWLDEQLSMPLKENQYLIKTIEMAKKMSPQENTYTVDEYLADNDIVFNKNVASFHSPRYRMTAWFDIALRSPDQLRAKVTYALSQIIVESDFEPIFTRRGEALATYFDILQRHAFGRYENLLNEISLNSGMGVFLTFNGSKKEYQNEANSTVYPDENYAREIMQLFSLGLEKLNIDGTPILDANGNPTPTYTQEDVNQLSRVFTGWDLKRNPRFGLVGFKRGDYTHPLEFTASYHDSGEKNILGQTIPSGLSGKEDIQRAVSIIMSQNSVAPYISKNLIMRLVKSNPSPSYIARVASVFNSAGGDLKAVVKAIFLDEELWQDLKEKNVVKFKEPLVAYTSFLRAFNVKPMPKWFYCGYGGPSDANASNCQVVEDAFLFNDTRDYLNQGAGLAPTVFNFYDNSFVPNSQEFKDSKSVAPEISIMNDTTFINFSNTIRNSLFGHEKNYMLNDWVWDYSGNNQPRKQYDTIVDYVNDAPIRRYIPFYYVGADKFLLDVTEELNIMEEVIDGDTNGDFVNLQDLQVQEYTDDEKAVEALVHYLNLKLTAGALSQEREAIITNAIKYEIFNKYNVGDPNAGGTDESGSNKKRQLLERVVFRAIRAVVTSSEYMTE